MWTPSLRSRSATIEPVELHVLPWKWHQALEALHRYTAVRVVFILLFLWELCNRGFCLHDHKMRSTIEGSLKLVCSLLTPQCFRANGEASGSVWWMRMCMCNERGVVCGGRRSIAPSAPRRVFWLKDAIVLFFAASRLSVSAHFLFTLSWGDQTNGAARVAAGCRTFWCSLAARKSVLIFRRVYYLSNFWLYKDSRVVCASCSTALIWQQNESLLPWYNHTC